ncbi:MULTISPECIES: ImuA family protein [unclassified Sphingobium]|uniref:ImuA family protein n=1 Tax=unclassified Sphingobium TaxID=2611147 RepID=UPI0035A6BC6A
MDSIAPHGGGRSSERTAAQEPASLPALGAGQLHEIHAVGEDRAAALAFALASGHFVPDGAIVALRVPGRSRLPTLFSGDGLALLGLDPARLTLVEPASEIDMLRAGLDAARCAGVAAVLIESEGRFADYDLTASRRLVLAAEASRACVILLRVDAQPRSSAARTRWSIASAPSVPLEADAPGWPAIDAELLRCRGGPAGSRWRLIWDMDHGCFRDGAQFQPQFEAMPGAVVPLPRLRTDAAHDPRRRVA